MCNPVATGKGSEGEEKEKGKDMLLLGVMEEKIDYRHMGEHSQRQDIWENLEWSLS